MHIRPIRWANIRMPSELLAIITDLSADITRRLGECMDKYGGDASANLDIATARQDVIKTFDEIGAVSTEIAEMIKLTNARLREAQNTELHRITEVLRGLNGTNDTVKAVVEHPQTSVLSRDLATTPRDNPPQGWHTGSRPKRTIAAVPAIISRVEPAPDMIRVEITKTCSLFAKPVETFNDVSADGRLYWVSTAGHFAIKIAGALFHGNIGTIYTDDKPRKIRDCAYPATCVRGDECRYYHDPLHIQGSTDVRNFAASSFTYTCPTYRRTGRTRQFGSLDHLDTDIKTVKAEESTRLRDQVMHDLLCALLLKDVFK